jgi:hypothetical protein
MRSFRYCGVDAHRGMSCINQIRGCRHMLCIMADAGTTYPFTAPAELGLIQRSYM